MRNIQKIIDKKQIIKLIVILASYLLLLSIPTIYESFNKQIERIFYSVRGELQADTNIVLIKITRDDIENLGGWPLKRNYYALLVNELLKYEPSVIGIEVLLASKSSSQNIYNDLLIEQFSPDKNIVLSSLLWDLKKRNGKYYTEEIIHSQLKLIDTTIITGHISYLDIDGYSVPLHVFKNGIKEKAFAEALAFQYSGRSSSRPLIKVNFLCSHNKYESYTLLDFFSILEEGKQNLSKLKNKIIIIGVSEPGISRNVISPFDSYLPGLGFHAMILNNIIHSAFINDDQLTLSTYLLILPLIIFAAIKFRQRIFIYYWGALLLALAFFFLLFSIFYIELNWSILIFPLLMLLVYESASYLSEKDELLEQFHSEKEILKTALAIKERDLLNLQKELNIHSGGDQQEVIEKINQLKKEIKKLKENAKDEEEYYESPEQNGTDNFFGLIFKNYEMKKLKTVVEKIAPQKATILIVGESGSGKELIANAIHKLSLRADNKFVAVNCAALTETLLESELFGHVKGAFTNAVSDKKGLFETADKGTIFLDEIGETSENFQAKLLRVLQSGEIQKVGSTESKTVDVRVITATNKDLEKLVREKKFREDLYYRLNVIRLNIPALNERKDDIPVIAAHFAEKEKHGLKISKAVIEQLVNYHWRGNVRELQSVIKRAAIFALSEGRGSIQLRDIPDEILSREKFDLENLILDSLRTKKFSHASINETAKELGDYSRTIISENFRGLFFKNYVQNEFDLVKTAKIIAGSEDKDVIEKVVLKGETYLSNIRRDLSKIESENFSEIKNKFSSKYKNLPQKYHQCLDSVIKRMLEKPE